MSAKKIKRTKKKEVPQANRYRIKTNISYDKQKEKYYVTFNYGKDPSTGKYVKTTKTYGTLKQAENALKEFAKKKARDEILPPSNATLIQRAEEYITSKKFAGREPATIMDYNKCLKQLKLYKPFSKKSIQEITTADLRGYFQHLKDDNGYCDNTIRKHHVFLKSVFNQSILERIIFYNPVTAIESPRKGKTCAQAIPPETAKLIYSKAKGTRLELLILLLFLGLRRGEIVGLRWEYVNLDAKTLTIAESIVQNGSTVQLKMPKTEGSIRPLEMPDVLCNALLNRKKELRAVNMKIKNINKLYVFGQADGSPYKPNYINVMINRFYEKHKLPHYRLHDYRHAFASIADMENVTTFDISKALGHANVNITANTYTHQYDESSKKAINAVYKVLSLDESGK